VWVILGDLKGLVLVNHLRQTLQQWIILFLCGGVLILTGCQQQANRDTNSQSAPVQKQTMAEQPSEHLVTTFPAQYIHEFFNQCTRSCFDELQDTTNQTKTLEQKKAYCLKYCECFTSDLQEKVDYAQLNQMTPAAYDPILREITPACVEATISEMRVDEIMNQ
jgi:hypothetical protein